MNTYCATRNVSSCETKVHDCSLNTKPCIGIEQELSARLEVTTQIPDYPSIELSIRLTSSTQIPQYTYPNTYPSLFHPADVHSITHCVRFPTFPPPTPWISAPRSLPGRRRWATARLQDQPLRRLLLHRPRDGQKSETHVRPTESNPGTSQRAP